MLVPSSFIHKFISVKIQEESMDIEVDFINATQYCLV